MTYAKQILCSRSRFFVSVFLRAVFLRKKQRFIYFPFIDKSTTSYVPCTSSVGLWVVRTIQDLGSSLAPVHICQKVRTELPSRFAKACLFWPPLSFLALGLRTLIEVFLLRHKTRIIILSCHVPLSPTSSPSSPTTYIDLIPLPPTSSTLQYRKLVHFFAIAFLSPIWLFTYTITLSMTLLRRLPSTSVIRTQDVHLTAVKIGSHQLVQHCWTRCTNSISHTLYLTSWVIVICHCFTNNISIECIIQTLINLLSAQNTIFIKSIKFCRLAGHLLYDIPDKWWRQFWP